VDVIGKLFAGAVAADADAIPAVLERGTGAEL
jgi:hypothetical protein